MIFLTVYQMKKTLVNKLKLFLCHNTKISCFLWDFLMLISNLVLDFLQQILLLSYLQISIYANLVNFRQLCANLRCKAISDWLFCFVLWLLPSLCHKNVVYEIILAYVWPWNIVSNLHIFCVLLAFSLAFLLSFAWRSNIFESTQVCFETSFLHWFQISYQFSFIMSCFFINVKFYLKKTNGNNNKKKTGIVFMLFLDMLQLV